MRRALGILPLTALLLAACARGTGAGGSNEPMTPSSSTPAMPSASASADAAGSAARVDIGDLIGDPASFDGQEVTILGRVDSVLADGQAFTTSASGDDNNILVVVADSATVEKDIAEKAVVFATGKVVPFTGDDLAALGATIGADQLGEYQGDYAIVATEIRDPLNSDS